MNALIVEDEWIISEELKEILFGCGFRSVRQVSSAEEAVACLLEHTFQIALLDIRVSGPMSGLDLARWITNNAECRIVFLTALNADFHSLDLESIAYQGYIVKPYHPNQVVNIVNKAMSTPIWKRQEGGRHSRGGIPLVVLA